MKVKEIQLDMKMIASIHNYWLFKHFKYLQLGDALTGNVARYQGWFMLQRYFSIWTQLDSCKEGNWKLKDEFRALQEDHIPDLQTKIDKKVKHIFRIVKAYLTKHFYPWCNKHKPHRLLLVTSW